MPYKSLLIIHQGALGDFILAFPAITRLQKYFKPIDVLGPHQLGKLAAALGLVDNRFAVEASSVASLFSDRIDPKMKKLVERYDKIVLFTFSDHLERSINRIKVNSNCRLPPKPPVQERIHVAQYALENLLDCGLITKADADLDGIPLPIREGRNRNHRKILLHPGAGSRRKRWPLPNFLRVADALKAKGLKPQFLLGPAEEALAEKLQHTDRKVQVLDDLRVLLELYDSAGGYIGNDSGASHLAAYSGLPTTVIFGPSDPARWAPVGRAVQIVRPGLHCRPCFEIEPADCDQAECLTDISPQLVLNAFYRIYSGRALD